MAASVSTHSNRRGYYYTMYIVYIYIFIYLFIFLRCIVLLFIVYYCNIFIKNEKTFFK